jgi:hypothetical protein
LQKAFARAIAVYSLSPGRFETVLAETSTPAACSQATVVSPERVIERSLPLASPHQTVDVIGSQVVFHQTEPEVASVWIPMTPDRRRLSVNVDLDRFVKARYVTAKHVLEPTDHFHLAPVRGRQYISDYVIAGVIRRLFGRYGSIPVILWVRCREVSATEVVVVFLSSVVGQWASTGLTASDAAPVREGRQKQRVYSGQLLKPVQHFIGAFINKGHGAGLNADHRRFRRCLNGGNASEEDASRKQRGLFQKRAAIHWQLLAALRLCAFAF